MNDPDEPERLHSVHVLVLRRVPEELARAGGSRHLRVASGARLDM
ncbi:hypothetical protein ACQP1V_03520 [Microtetraspora malaysiensis]